MLDARNAEPEAKTWVLFCPECEEQFGTTVELRLDHSDRSKEARQLRVRLIQRFERIHESCGEKELSARLDAALGTQEEWTWDVARIRAIYAENPGIKFEEMRRIFREQSSPPPPERPTGTIKNP